jgi:hypothetical protein
LRRRSISSDARDSLIAASSSAGTGARRIEGLLKTEDGQKRFELELLRPCGDAARLEAMLRVKLEQVRLLGPALGVSLRVAAEEQIAEEQSELFDGPSWARHGMCWTLPRW